ncbi:bifunctional aspartate kinase/homoserine dehydrogenase II [Aliagarivorans marinus]|uniref:bifunctional aspartate kinase/homoserine dehydrogenase II n=1 Tax=Aliagarivorans marinus TaxID=561965 RepID=UPI0003FE2C21|nr:bifunctional aspartate kinase/homoserine dehydrogenase II [Aliagarivorans marinus]
MSNRHVHKFGGSSLADAACFQRVAEIVISHSDQQDLIVVSAAGKTTNRILTILQLASDADMAAAEGLSSLIAFQRGLVEQLLESVPAAELIDMLEADHREMSGLLEGGLDPFVRNELLSFGERWSARLLNALLNQRGCESHWLDSRQFFKAERGAQPQVDAEQSAPLLGALLEQHPGCRIVVTGFIASDSQGRTVTLGRNGSDYSATELAALCDAVSTTIWSDVAGIYSADPRLVKDARLLEKLALNEAAELSRIGNSVLHARTLEPVRRSRQRVSLRCSYSPDEGQTQIHRQRLKSSGAKIVTSVEQLVLCELQFAPDHADNATAVISELEACHLSPITLHHHQASGALRLAYTPELVDEVLARLNEWQARFAITDIARREDYSLIALVGAGVAENTEQCYHFFQHLAKQPLEFIHSSKDKLSLCAVLRKVALEPLIKELHGVMFKPPVKLGLVVFGRGNIGSHWLELLARQRKSLEDKHNIQLSLAALLDSDGLQLDFNGLDLDSILDEFSPQPFVWQELLDTLKLHPFDELVVVDITASETVSNYYGEFASRGFHVIAANKLASSAPYEEYRALKQRFVDHNAYWLANATVGGALPVQSAIHMLNQSGDQVKAISGIFSGTLSLLFQQFDGSVPFSVLLEQAWQRGLTEPDPREDLSGQDVRRKLLMLAREAGMALDIRQIKLQSLIPESLLELSVDEFLDELHQLDELMEQALEDARGDGLVLRYVARIERDGSATVGLETLEPDEPFANLKPCDHVFAIESDWYKPYPMVIQGPGSGRDVTAGALQADLVSLCKRFS